MRVLTSGRGLANARYAIAQADVARLATGVAELHKAPIFAGHDELRRSRWRLVGGHTSLKYRFKRGRSARGAELAGSSVSENSGPTSASPRRSASNASTVAWRSANVARSWRRWLFRARIMAL